MTQTTIPSSGGGAHPRREAGTADDVIVAVCDLNGIFRGKRLISADPDKLAGGVRMPMSSVGVDVWGCDVVDSGLTLEKGDMDGICVATGRGPLPVLGSGDRTPLVPMWMSREGGTPFFSDARHVLANVLARFEQAGLTPVVATELEFHLLDSGAASTTPASLPPGSADRDFENIYSIHEIVSAAAFLDDVGQGAQACGIRLESIIAEGGPRQYEVTLSHQPDALRAADDAVLIKQILRSTAHAHGMQACFMAKPYPLRAGNGLHVHMSLLDSADVNVFDDGSRTGSDMLRQTVAGLIESMAELTLIFAPHINSYRRLRPGSLAPTSAVWGHENRTAAVRIPGGPLSARRIEHRVAGADANPYLVLSAILAAALDGIGRNLCPPPPIEGNAYVAEAPSLEPDWYGAIERFAGSDLARRLLHPELVHFFSACKRQELDVFSRQISEFEFATYRSSV